MTVGELKQEIEDIPDDYIVCSVSEFAGAHFEVTSIETLVGLNYYDGDDNIKRGNVLEI